MHVIRKRGDKIQMFAKRGVIDVLKIESVDKVPTQN